MWTVVSVQWQAFGTRITFRRGIYWPTEKLSTFQGRPCTMGLVG